MFIVTFWVKSSFSGKWFHELFENCNLGIAEKLFNTKLKKVGSKFSLEKDP